MTGSTTQPQGTMAPIIEVLTEEQSKAHAVGYRRLPIEPRGRLWITSNLSAESWRYPNAWVRFWHKALLGWRWERIP